ncbi:polysaccharide deacetylase family protein [Aureibaculum sp. 2210JD6-5]|uniref:polysaccharide deacetylase family protein n=1 Tax=Aureibaculum sp. 2210JD6-5 TaxID=3103957 RepID=UPI002AAD4C31|nr:polysaccharide deacetylase family protein [Aureibaculum sp. 2210JD6-5]MDY7394079.1 polysaccharide deacetylase family protein [Aureibaculum sp. 2210JD6-5]
MKKKYCLLSNDVETTSIWHNTLRDETGYKVLTEGMPLLLDLYEKYDVKSTFYFTGYIAKLYPEIVKMVVPYGHEVGSHGLSHTKKNGFDVMPLEKQIRHLKTSKDIIENIIGEEIISFRAPALRVNNDTAIALAETGYKIDSSVASQRFDMFMSFGSLKKLNWLTAPRLPYRTSKDSLFKKGDGQIIEVPLSASLIPYLSTTMRIFPYFTAIQRRIMAFEASKTGKPIVFDTHPNEFIDESYEKRQINKRSKNIVASFLQDTVRSKLKVKNLGIKGVKIYEREIKYFHKHKFEFCTIKEFCKQKGLLK